MSKPKYNPSKVKPKGEQWQLVQNSLVLRNVSLRDGSHEFARARGTAKCPFCGAEHTVFWWSLAGSGKRCDCCGALICYGNAVYPAEKYPFKDELT